MSFYTCLSAGIPEAAGWCFVAGAVPARAKRSKPAMLKDFAGFKQPCQDSFMSDAINLDDDQARYIDALVRSGRFADRREVVQAGLDALRDRDATVERWLREDVVPVAAAMMADPSRAIPIDDVMADLERHHLACVAAGARGA